MKSCPACGQEYDDELLFCDEDGERLKESSTLNELSQESADSPPGAAEPVEEKQSQAAEPVVLYCPACAAEYPLTFTACPVHGAELVKHNIPARVAQPAAPAGTPEREAQQEATAALAAATAAESLQDEAPAGDYTVSDNTVSDYPVSEHAVSDYAAAGVTHATRSGRIFSYGAEPESGPEGSAAGEQPIAERQSHRIAAIATAVGLAMLALVAIYSVATNARRKPAPRPAQSSSPQAAAPEQVPFVPAPQAAQDYKEEEPQKAASAGVDQKAEAPEPEKQAGKEKAAKVMNIPPPSGLARQEPQRPSGEQEVLNQPRPVAAASKSSGYRELVLPRGTFGLVDARLVRVRARRVSSGFLYDLTFNLQDQAGHTTYWERLSINTRTASGQAHSETLPFQHRLGAAGAMTFTVSVQMPGRGETDWQGRIICTTVGSDESGKVVRASFGANVSP